MPYARNEGKAEAFIRYARKSDVAIGGILTLIIFVALLGLKGVAIFFSSLVPILIFIRYSQNRIGGMTGDTIGAISEIAEASALFSLLIVSLV